MNERERTRYCIETALIKLMENKPIDKITISEICDKAGVARASFYRNFESKHEVVTSFLDSRDKAFWSDLRFVPRSIEDYELICQRIFEQVESVSWRYEAFRRSHLTDVLYRFITTCFLRRTSTITDSDATNYINIGYAGALANIIINWLEEGCATPRDQVSEAMVSIIFPRSDTLERLRTGVPVALS